jgi:hypothetical protein
MIEDLAKNLPDPSVPLDELGKAKGTASSDANSYLFGKMGTTNSPMT